MGAVENCVRATGAVVMSTVAVSRDADPARHFPARASRAAIRKFAVASALQSGLWICA